jgi:membrane protein
MAWLVRGRRFLTRVVRTAYDQQIRYPAAALAYYAFVSFVPLLTMLFAVLGDRAFAQFERMTPQFLTPEAQELVQQSLSTASGRLTAGVLAVLVLGWSSMNIVGDVRTVVERVEGIGDRSPRARLRDGVVVLWSLGAAMVVIAATSVLFQSAPDGLIVSTIGFLSLWLALSIVFVPLYFVPSIRMTTLRDAVPGAAIAGFGWAVIHSGVLFYASNAGQYAVYGVLSGVIIILTSLYLAAAVLFTGIIINVVVLQGPSDHW